MASVKDLFQNLRISEKNLQFSRIKTFLWRHYDVMEQPIKTILVSSDSLDDSC